MKKKTLILSALLLVVLALEGCATIRGIAEVYVVTFTSGGVKAFTVGPSFS